MLATAYVRWSSDQQTRGSSETRQTQLAQQMCATKGWTLQEIIIDSGKSAFHGTNRATGGNLAEIERRAAEGKLAGQVLIVENLDRLSRQEPLHSLNLMQSLANHGVTIAESASNSVYTAESIRENWLTLLSAFIRAGLAYDESLKKSRRLKAAWEVARERGTTKDGKADPRICPTWIEVVEGEYAVIEDRAATIRWICEQCAEGKGLNWIARELNADPSSNRWTKGAWTQSNICSLLRRRNVLGEHRSMQKQADGKRVPIGEWQPRYPAIVSVELWHRVQLGLDSRRTEGGPRRGFSNVLQGFCRCGVCQSRLNLKAEQRTRRQRQSDTRTLICSGYHRGVGCTNNKSVLYRHVLDSVIDHALQYAIKADALPSDAKVSIAHQEAELEKAELGLGRLMDLFAESGSGSARAGVKRAEARVEASKRALGDAKRAVEATNAKVPAKAIADQIEAMRSELETSADVRRKVNSLLREVIDGAWWYGEQRQFLVLVAGVHVLAFDHEGTFIGEQVATSALISEAGRKGAALTPQTAIALERWEQQR